MKRLAVVVTHPIQYYAPLFRCIAERKRVALKVFYTWGEQVLAGKYDPGFNKEIRWDLPLLEGYEYHFLKNTSSQPGSHHFIGIQNPDIVQEITKWKPDAILVFGWNFSSHLKVLRYFKGKIPVFFRGDSTLLNEKNGLKKLLRRVALRWVYSHVDIALYVGEENKQYYEAHGLSNSQLIYAPHAVDNDRFGKLDIERNSEALHWRQTLGIPDSAGVFMFAGKLELVKNIHLLIDAFSLAKKTNSFLIIAGNGVLESEIRQKAEGMDNIIFLGFQNQLRMPVLYRVADVYILPSISETWGLAVNEAMACSRAVIVSKKCGCATDLVHEGYNGYTFDPYSVKDLTDKLKICDDRALVQKLGMHSKQIIERFHFDAIASSLETLLD